MTARLFSLCTAAALVAAPLGMAHAQSTETDMNGTPSRFALELYLAQYSVDNPAPGEGRTGVGGVGARMMFGNADATKVVSTFFNRARAGIFATYTAEKDFVSTWHIGGQADFPLFAAPVANGFLDPFVSLGAGIFRATIDNDAFGGNVPSGFDASSNDFALTPAIGTLIPITGAIKFRGDLRDVITFDNGTTNNFVAEGGISIGF